MRTSRIQDLPDQDRPREKLAKRGARALSDAELLAIFLRVGIQGTNAVELGAQLLEKHGSLAGLARCSVQELAATKGVGMAKGAQLAAAFELGSRLAMEKIIHRPMDKPEQVHELLAPEMRTLRHETLRVVLLDTRHHLIQTVEITKGTLNESLAHPREIFRAALVHSANSFILVHNHPSGDPTPSRADRDLTKRIDRASRDIGIPLVDHIIIGAPSEDRDPYFSFREFGLL